MFPTNDIYTHPRDIQQDFPAAYDDDGAEVWPGSETIKYEDRDIVWETFRDKIISLVSDRTGAICLARAMDLDIKEYE